MPASSLNLSNQPEAERPQERSSADAHRDGQLLARLQVRHAPFQARHCAEWFRAPLLTAGVVFPTVRDGQPLSCCFRMPSHRPALEPDVLKPVGLISYRKLRLVPLFAFADPFSVSVGELVLCASLSYRHESGSLATILTTFSTALRQPRQLFCSGSGASS
jgi:hypothetical protein